MQEQLLSRLLFVESQCINPQDALLIRLLIEGFEVHEIIYLKKDSLDAESRTITFKDSDSNKKQYRVSPRCVQLFMDAASQIHYISKNGFDYSKVFKIALKDSSYVIKVSNSDYLANESMIQEMDSVVLRTIYTRLRTLAEIYNLPEITFVTTVRVESSHNLIYA